MAKPRHPTQTIYRDAAGVVRFRPNAIVTYLLDSHPHANMNTLAAMPFSREDRGQFAQLIGYSVSGFGNLSYARKETVAAADAIADKLTRRHVKK